MKQRCLNPTSQVYKYYGGRGIFIYSKWIDDPKAYIEYIMGLPDYGKPGLTLDRIKNNQGYKPGNLRWTTRHIQQANQGVRKNNTSGYTGISFDNVRKKWMSEIMINRIAVRFGRYEDIQDAINVRNQYITDNKLFEYPLQSIRIT